TRRSPWAKKSDARGRTRSGCCPPTPYVGARPRRGSRAFRPRTAARDGARQWPETARGRGGRGPASSRRLRRREACPDFIGSDARSAKHNEELPVAGADRLDEVGGDISQNRRQLCKLGRIEVRQADNAIHADGHPPLS